MQTNHAQAMQATNDLLNSLTTHTLLTHDELQKIDQDEAALYVQTVFGFSVKRYNTIRYNAGQNYLIYYTGNDAQLVTAFMKCKAFWQWWNNEYANRDILFMHWDCTETPSNKWYNKYLQIHDSRTLAETRYPGEHVWAAMKSEGLI